MTLAGNKTIDKGDAIRERLPHAKGGWFDFDAPVGCGQHIGDGSIRRINPNSNDIAVWGFHATKNFLTYYFVSSTIRLPRFEGGNIS